MTLIAGIALLSCRRGTLGYSCVMSTNVTFSTPSGDAAGYLSTPESGLGPGVIVVQEWWGLDSGIIDICDDLARNGFVALAPDLYHGELAGHTEMDKAGELMTSLPMDRAAQDMSGAVDYLVAHESTSSSTLAVMGFCMGGMLTFVLAALRPDAISAAVPFYGFPSGDDQPDYSNITAKIRGHMAEVDGFFPPEGAADLEQRLQAAGVDATLTVHPGTGHAFMASHNALGTQDNDLAARLWPEVHAFIRDTVS